MTIDNISNAIKRLETINPLEEYAYEKAIMAFLSVKRLPILIFEIPEEQKICRARTAANSDFYSSVNSISIPPTNGITDFARCNRPFQAKFYGSENRPTSFFELVEYWAETKSFGEKIYVTVGLWQTKKPLFSIIVTSPTIKNRTSDFDKFHGQGLDNFIEKQEGEMKDAVILFYEFLFERFRKAAKHDPLTYIITTSYCNVALTQAEGQANCILYPSVPFGGQGVNFAISSSFMKPENIELTDVICSELTISENENHKHTFTETKSWTAKAVRCESNEIIW